MIVLLKHFQKRGKTNTDKIETTGNTYMHTKTHRNTQRQAQPHTQTHTHTHANTEI